MDEIKQTPDVRGIGAGWIGLGVLLLFPAYAIGNGNNGAAAVAVLVLVADVLFLYFVPAVNAQFRKHPSATAITLLSLLAGWTVIGWLAALLWSYSGADAVVAPVDQDELKDCPYCAEPIRAAAIKCRFCGSDVSQEASS